MDALDRYEGVDRGLSVRVRATVGGTVHTYVGDPEALDAPATWPGSGPLEDRVAAYCDAESVRIDVG